MNDLGNKIYRVISSRSLQNLNNSNCYVASSQFQGNSIQIPTGSITGDVDVCGTDLHPARDVSVTINYQGNEFPWTYYYTIGGGPVQFQTVNSGSTSTKIISIRDNTAVKLVKIVTSGCSGGLEINQTHTIQYSTGIPSTPIQIHGENPACIGDVAYYYVDPVPGAVSYNWVVSDGWQIVSGQGNSRVQLKVGSSPIQVQITSKNACGTSTYTSSLFQVTNGVPNHQRISLLQLDYVCSLTHQVLPTFYLNVLRKVVLKL